MSNALARLSPRLKLAVGLCVVTVLLSLVLELVTDRVPGLLRYRMAGSGFERDIAQRVAATEGQYQEGKIGRDEHLCALLGLSGLREGADLKLLSQAGGGKWRYLGLCGAGAAFDSVVTETHRLFEGDLRPDVTLLGVSAFLLVEPKASPAGGGGASDVSQALAQRDLWRLARTGRDSLWFVRRRRDIEEALEESLLDTKQTMLRAFGADRATSDNPANDPWREMIRLEIPEHPSASALNQEIAAYEARGLFDPASYQPESTRRERGALNQLVRQLKDRGSTVLVVVMPEYSVLRARLPAIGMEALRSGLEQEFGTGAPRVVDLRAATPDSGFSDISHVNGEGRLVVSKLLAAEVAAAVPSTVPPLMALPRNH